MCKVLLAGSEHKFEYLNNVVVLPDRVDVYDFQNKLIMTLPQGKQKRNEFEILSHSVLSCIENSLEFDYDDDVSERVLFSSFYNPAHFLHDMEIVFDSLDESLEKIEELKRAGVDTSGMANFANDHWSSNGNA